MFNYPESTNQFGYNYGVARPQARNTQPLTAEQIQKLRNNSEAFDMKVTQEELWAAACTHKEKTGQNALRDNGDGTYTCSICHETFKLCDASVEDIEKAVETVSNMLQTVKTVYLDAPEELILQYFQIDPLLKKLPTLWKHAMRNFSQYEGYNPAMNSYPIGYSGFAAINQLMTNPYMGAYGQPAPQAAPAPQYGAPMQAPVYAQQPMMGGYGAPMAPGYNPMAYGAPQVAPAPMAPAPGVMPGAAPVAPAAVAPQTAEVQQQQVFNV